MTVIETSQFRLFFKSAGEDKDQKLLYLHGNPGSSDDLHPECFNGLAKDFHIVAMDRPGHGKSLSSQFGMSTNLEAIEEITKHLGWSSFGIIAHSWSTALALDYAAEHGQKVNALLLVNPWAYPRKDDSPASTALPKLLKVPGIYRFLRSKIEAGIKSHLEKCFAPSKAPAPFLAEKSFEKNQVLAMLEDKQSLIESFPRIIKKYDRVLTKTLILAAKDDQITSFVDQAEKLFQNLPNASLISEATGGHAFPYLESSPIVQNAHLLKEDIRHAANQNF